MESRVSTLEWVGFVLIAACLGAIQFSIFIAQGLLFSAAPILLAADWGRYIYLMITHVFLAVVALGPMERASAPAATARSLLLSGAFLFLYATSWTLLHFQVPGQSPLEPGPLFWATGRVLPVLQ